MPRKAKPKTRQNPMSQAERSISNAGQRLKQDLEAFGASVATIEKDHKVKRSKSLKSLLTTAFRLADQMDFVWAYPSKYLERTNPKRRKTKPKKKTARKNPGRIMVTAEEDNMGNLTVYPTSERIQKMYGNKGLFFNADTANLYDFIEHNVPKAKRSDLRRGYAINFLLSEEAFAAWVEDY